MCRGSWICLVGGGMSVTRVRCSRWQCVEKKLDISGGWMGECL